MMARLNAAFWKWFGNSVVRNADGSPKVMYHATGDPLIRLRSFAFDESRREFGCCHFGSRKQAMTFIDFFTTGYRDALKNNLILPVYLSVENPIRFSDYGVWRSAEVYKNLSRIFGGSRLPFPAPTWSPRSKKTEARYLAEVRQWLIESGYDGVVYLNRWEGMDYTEDRLARKDYSLHYTYTDQNFLKYFPNAEDSYITFYPEQAKSIYNAGTWDAKDPRIMRNPNDGIGQE